MHPVCRAALVVLLSVCPVDATIRLFMVPDGDQGAVADGQTPVLYVSRGATAGVTAWVVDDEQVEAVNGYQLVWPKSATPQAGAVGTVAYLDRPGAPFCVVLDPLIFGALCDLDDPRTCDGHPNECFDLDNNNTLLVDLQRPDYLYADDLTTPPFYSEGASADPTLFGVIVNLFDPTAGITLPPTPRYLAQFALQASDDAAGTFQLNFNTVPPGTYLFRPQGPIVPDLQFQPLEVRITVCGDGVVEGDEACDDDNTLDGDGCSRTCTVEVPVPALRPAGLAALCTVLLLAVLGRCRRAA